MDLVDTNWISQLEVATKVVIAGCLGGVIGLERELANRPAGLRTHAILAAAAALLIGITDLLVEHFTSESATAMIMADPIRVIEAIVAAVGFIGAGTIFRHHRDDVVEGLTTAASMLLVAAVGIAVATRQLLLAVSVTLLTLVLLRVVGAIARKRPIMSRRAAALDRAFKEGP